MPFHVEIGPIMLLSAVLFFVRLVLHTLLSHDQRASEQYRDSLEALEIFRRRYRSAGQQPQSRQWLGFPIRGLRSLSYDRIRIRGSCGSPAISSTVLLRPPQLGGVCFGFLLST